MRLAGSLKLEEAPSRLLFAAPVGPVSGSASPQLASLTGGPSSGTPGEAGTQVALEVGVPPTLLSLGRGHSPWGP